MDPFILDIVNRFGYFGVFFLIAVENIFPPIPSEIILTFSGFLTTVSAMHIPGVVIASTLGSVLGAIILYAVGRVVTPERLDKLIRSRTGRVLRLKKADFSRANAWFGRHGGKAVFFGRFIPVVRSLISIPAGASRMPLRAFLPLTVLGTAIWNTVLVFLGSVAGEAWESIGDYVSLYSAVAICILVVILVWLIARAIRRRRAGAEENGGAGAETDGK